jgi:small subunit ribosomal protein S17
MKKTLTGKVLSTKMQKTVVVEVVRKYRHALYKKVIVKHKKYKVHNELNDINVGDQVVIEETRPISKDKHFKVIKKL